MTLPKYALAYDACTLDELRIFVYDRNLTERTSSTNREECIHLLRDADKSSTFRFPDLAAEIRNRVYEELLSLHDNGKCHPQILRASKSIHRDASEMIYSINTPTIRFVANDLLFLEKRRARYDRRYEPTTKLNPAPWPLPFLKFEKVRILLDEEALYDAVDEGYPRSAWENDVLWSLELYALVTFLQNSHSLRNVVVEGKAFDTVNHLGCKISTESRMEEHSFPLSRLCANFKVEFKNMDHWPNFEAKVREDARVHKDLLRYNILLGMQCVQTERVYCHRLLGTLGKIAPLEVVEEFQRISSQMNWRYDVICWLNADMEQHMKNIIIKSSPILDEIFSLATSRNHGDPQTEEYVEAHAIRLSLDIQ
ncbi:hypothetical protein AC578_974 [Pseudocercospora eumusae]|uniref:Uncharacterized protein n=1 Tax=Pseudocercospora eumusae TaxID=321146 RepID=A0A139HEL8_9PEZI|nr:hypothetical protein AC578_974 [Pseudocercospora eumusae]